MVHTLPDRKNNFRIWVARSSHPANTIINRLKNLYISADQGNFQVKFLKTGITFNQVPEKVSE